MRYLAVLALLVMTSLTASAGPLRDWVREHRPGILIPKPQPAYFEPAPAIQQAPMYYYVQQPAEGYVWYTGVQPAGGCPSCASGSCNTIRR